MEKYATKNGPKAVNCCPENKVFFHRGQGDLIYGHEREGVN